MQAVLLQLAGTSQFTIGAPENMVQDAKGVTGSGKGFWLNRSPSSLPTPQVDELHDRAWGSKVLLTVRIRCLTT